MVEEKEENKEEKIEEAKEEIPEGFYLAKVPTEYGIIIMKGKEEVSQAALLVETANAVEKAGLNK